MSDPEIPALTRVIISAPSWYEALDSPMVVVEGWWGPLPRSDNPFEV